MFSRTNAEARVERLEQVSRVEGPPPLRTSRAVETPCGSVDIPAGDAVASTDDRV